MKILGLLVIGLTLAAALDWNAPLDKFVEELERDTGLEVIPGSNVLDVLQGLRSYAEFVVAANTKYPDKSIPDVLGEAVCPKLRPFSAPKGPNASIHPMTQYLLKTEGVVIDRFQTFASNWSYYNYRADTAGTFEYDLELFEVFTVRISCWTHYLDNMNRNLTRRFSVSKLENDVATVYGANKCGADLEAQIVGFPPSVTLKNTINYTSCNTMLGNNKVQIPTGSGTPIEMYLTSVDILREVPANWANGFAPARYLLATTPAVTAYKDGCVDPTKYKQCIPNQVKAYNAVNKGTQLSFGLLTFPGCKNVTTYNQELDVPLARNMRPPMPDVKYQRYDYLDLNSPINSKISPHVAIRFGAAPPTSCARMVLGDLTGVAARSTLVYAQMLPLPGTTEVQDPTNDPANTNVNFMSMGTPSNSPSQVQILRFLLNGCKILGEGTLIPKHLCDQFSAEGDTSYDYMTQVPNVRTSQFGLTKSTDTYNLGGGDNTAKNGIGGNFAVVLETHNGTYSSLTSDIYDADAYYQNPYATRLPFESYKEALPLRWGSIIGDIRPKLKDLAKKIGLHPHFFN